MKLNLAGWRALRGPQPSTAGWSSVVEGADQTWGAPAWALVSAADGRRFDDARPTRLALRDPSARTNRGTRVQRDTTRAVR